MKFEKWNLPAAAPSVEALEAAGYPALLSAVLAAHGIADAAAAAEFLNIEETETENITTEEFISEVVDMPVETVKKEIDVYEDDLNGYADNVIKYGSKLLDAANHMSLLAVIAYAYQNDIEIDAWLKEYAENNNTYILNQKQNFLQMRNDLNKYQERMGVA